MSTTIRQITPSGSYAGTGGRPSTYKPEYCERVIALGAEGKSKVEICHELDIGRTTMQSWEAEHEAFRVAMARAKDAEQVWWERKGRDNLATQGFQSSMWSRSMAARFPNDWREVSRQEQTGPNGGAIQTETRVIKMVVVDPASSEQK